MAAQTKAVTWRLRAQSAICKGTNLTSIDPDTGRVTLLFNPRQHRWADHFAHIGGNIEGKTPVGRTTVSLLEMNGAERLRLRQHLLRLGLLNE